MSRLLDGEQKAQRAIVKVGGEINIIAGRGLIPIDRLTSRGQWRAAAREAALSAQRLELLQPTEVSPLSEDDAVKRLKFMPAVGG